MGSNYGNWNARQNKLFENALAMYGEETTDRWQKMARFIGGNKTAEDVKRHYDLLVDEVSQIESGQVPLPNYKQKPSASGQPHQQEQMMRYLKLQ
ncbi:protein RADIALIS-like 4 [Impatiens glandulifera]|uniref:protein RADIALIS-like 4 n=1 Tax=Impatiens glandulifera TaxID=253017 RepID=UPI001FB15A77|nr:protein RADIALIS-like 4 [Impatiens glandulifera]